MTRLKQLLRGVQNIYHQHRGQHLSQKKVGETHLVLIQHTVPTEFLGRSYPATAPGGKMAKQASQPCPVPSISHTQTHICHWPLHAPQQQLLQHKSVQQSSKLQLRRCLTTGNSTLCTSKHKPLSLFPKLLAIPVLKDIHIFHLLVQASQAFTAHELSVTDLFRILSFIRHLWYLPQGGKGAKIPTYLSLLD